MGKLKTKEKISTAINEWNYPFKITIDLIAIKINMSERTIKNYWIDFKDEVSMINKKIKLENINLIKNK